MKVVLHGTFAKGRFEPDLPQAAVWAALGKDFQGRVTVTIESERKIRTNAQNDRYWQMCEDLIGMLSSSRDVPLSKEQVHYVLKSAFLGCIETPLGLVPKDSHDLTTAEFAEYSDKVEAHFRAEGVRFRHDPMVEEWT